MGFYTLIKPILDNKSAFRSRFPGATYSGDIGDSSHQARPSDHNPSPDSTYWWVRAQDLGDGGGFQLQWFARWFLDRLREGWFPEVQYVITRHPGNLGTNYYGLFDRRYGWAKQSSSGHDHHIHISYRKGYEWARSEIVEQWHLHQNRATTIVEEDDDMPFGIAIDLHGLKVGEPKEVTIAPVNTGGMGFGKAWMSIGSGQCDAKIQVAIQLDGEDYWRPWQGSWDNGAVVLVKSGSPRSACGAVLPDGTGKVEFTILEVAGDNPDKFTCSAFIEYGKK